MQKKVSIKSLFLLLVISLGLIGLGIGSTYAVFTARDEIDNPIVLNSNLTYDSNIMDTIEVGLHPSQFVSVTLNINNTSDSDLNYVVWYLDESNGVATGTSSGSPQGLLASGDSTTVIIDLWNKGSEPSNVIVGVFSGTEIVLEQSMTPVSSSSFTKGSQISYENSSTGVECSDVTCMLDALYDITTIKEGDYVYYKPTVTSYPVDTSMTGYTGTADQTIYPEELELWRVLNINSDGTIDLISEYVSSTNVYFSSKKGYLNFVGYLNELASQYETEGITDGSRYFGFNGQTEYIKEEDTTDVFVNPAPWLCSTGGSCDPAPVESKGGGDTLYTTDFNRVNTVLGTRVAYKVGTTTATNYWMASRYYYYSSSSYSWNGRYVFTSGSNTYDYHYSYFSDDFYEYDNKNALRPVVTLKSGLTYGGAGTVDNPRRIITS